MVSSLCILDRLGDTEIRWDHNNPIEVDSARKIVQQLLLQGYSFFLVDGTPADAIAAGAGTLIVRRLTADEVVDPPAAEQAPDTPADPPQRRGRPPKADRQAIAVRPLSGG